MNHVKCECGHVNPLGTVICEACGRTIGGNPDKKLLDMRYEGTARRSQTYNKTFIDKVWNFFSSVKVGVALIVITLIASAIGTIFPQEMNTAFNGTAEQFYQEEYGWIGQIYYLLGFHDLYRSWWYILLVASIGVSLVVCSLDRVVPLYKALKNQRVKRHMSFLKRQRFFNKKQMVISDDQINHLTNKLKKKGYRVSNEEGDILAEKGRFSRWGPYINHIGLIIFLFGVMLRFVPGFYFNDTLQLKDGETLAIPGTDREYFLKNNQFIVEYYDESDGEVYQNALTDKGFIPKNYQSNVTLYQAVNETLPGESPELERVKDFEIQVNQPLKFEQFALYQSSFYSEISSMTFALTHKESGEEFGTVAIDLANPEKIYDLGNGYQVEVMSYFPDFEFTDGTPTTKTPYPNNPAFAFRMSAPDMEESETSFAAIMQTIEPFGENQYKMAFKTYDNVSYTILTVRKDLTLWVVSIGGLIFLIGVAQGSFWQHRRIWFKQEKGEVAIAAHTNKNWYSLFRELESLLTDTDLPIPIDQSTNNLKEKQQGVDTVG